MARRWGYLNQLGDGTYRMPSRVDTSRAFPGRLAPHGEQLPGRRHAFEIVLTAVAELDARANYEVLHGRGDEDLPGLRQPSDAGSGTDRDTGPIIVANFTFWHRCDIALIVRERPTV